MRKLNVVNLKNVAEYVMPALAKAAEENGPEQLQHGYFVPEELDTSFKEAVFDCLKKTKNRSERECCVVD